MELVESNHQRFLMSHPKSFSNVSDEDSLMTRDDSDDEAINDEEEMPLEIPVVKPPSCGSSTQVHVSEQGHGEEMLGLPAFGDDAMPARDSGDNVHLLTEEVLKKHTRLQERLYIQTISEEQPLLLNMRRLKSSKNTPVQKRPRPREPNEEVDIAKHPCTNSGVFRSSSNIFMQSFPAVTSSELTTVTTSTQPLFHQAEMPPGLSYDPRLMGQSSQLGYSQFQTGYQSSSLAHHSDELNRLDPAIHGLNRFDLPTRSPYQNLLWPYYPQTGYSLLPQVMSGFFQPHLQQVQAQSGQSLHINFMNGPQMTNSQTAEVRSESLHPQPQKKLKTDLFCHNRESDQPPSSVDDTTSSILYLLEADSSTFEDSDNKASSALAIESKQNKRAFEPAWLRGIKWNNDIKMRYQMPEKKVFSQLKMDDKFLKKTPHHEMVVESLEQLLKDVSLPGHDDPIDEEADFMMFLGDEALDNLDQDSETAEEVYMTGDRTMLQDEGVATMEEVVWNDDESFDTPVNSHSEDEKAPSTPLNEEAKEVETPSTETVVDSNTSLNKVPEGSGDISMDTIYMNSGEASDNIAGIKGSSSPIAGSFSGDEGSGSDGGQKAEMEDAQSNCSKVSSDLTPSDDRSNEEAGSSMKESDASTKKMKGVSSVASTNSSNDHISQEEGSTAVLTKDAEDIIKKLFVPLKVKVTKRLETVTYPYWLIEAHYSPQVALTYKIPTRNLEEVLREDKRKMTDLVQSSTVKQQLLQLLSEVDVKYGGIVPSTSPMNQTTQSPYSQASSLTFLNKLSSKSDSAVGTVTEEDLSTSDDKSLSDRRHEQREIPYRFVHLSPSTVVVSQGSSGEACRETLISKTDSKASLCEQPSHLTMVSSAFNVFMGNLHSGCSEKYHKGGKKTGHNNYSDSNTDLVADESTSGSMSAGQSSGAVTLVSSSLVNSNVSRMESHLQERFQAIESGNVAGQKIEDIIMSKVFVPVESVSTTNTETKPAMSNIFILNE